jgi:hypothetical protein
MQVDLEGRVDAPGTGRAERAVSEVFPGGMPIDRIEGKPSKESPGYFGMESTLTSTVADPSSRVLFIFKQYEGLFPDYRSHKAQVVAPPVRGESYNATWEPGVLGFLEPLSGVWGINPYLNADWDTWQRTTSHEGTHYSNQVMHNRPMAD